MRFLSTVLTLGLLPSAGAQTIFTAAGLPYSHRASIDGKAALDAPLSQVYGLLIDKVTGRLLLHDERLVSRLEPDGTLLALVGMGRGNDGAMSDGTPASGLYIAVLRGMAQDAAGNLYLADASYSHVSRVALDGRVTTFAGGGPNFPGDGGPALSGVVSSPRGLVFDSQGNLDIADTGCHCIRQVSTAGILSTLFVLPQQPGFFQYFEGLAIDAQDNIYAAVYRGSQVWRIAADGSGAAIAGTGVPGFSGDGGPAAAAQLNGPSGVTLDDAGNIYVCDTLNHRVRRIAPDGTISTVAGTGVPGFGGDGGPAAAAQFFLPAEAVFDAAGNMYISDYGNRRVRIVTPGGVISTIAGSGVPDAEPISNGDGGPALHAAFRIPYSTLTAPNGDLYVAELGGARIRKISPDGIVTTVAGNGVGLLGGTEVPATQTSISTPITLVRDTAGTLYFTVSDSRVLKVTPDGILHLVAGSGPGSGLIRSQGDGGFAVDATLNEPKGLAVDAQGNVFIGDTSNARLRKVDTYGTITTVAGPGTLGTDYWNAVAFDPQGNLYVTITRSDVIHGMYFSVVDRVNPDGTLTTVAGNQQTCANLPTQFVYDGAPALQTPLCVIVGLTFDSQGVMYIPESFYGSVLRVAPDGTVQRIAGNSRSGTLGDGGSPLLANLQGSSFYSPDSVAFDANGNAFLPQAGTGRIREIIAGPLVVHTSKDKLDFTDGPAVAQSLQITTNIAEPLPFALRITANGVGWLTANRLTGQTGDVTVFSVNPKGLAPGLYTAAVQIEIPGSTAMMASVPVTLTVH